MKKMKKIFNIMVAIAIVMATTGMASATGINSIGISGDTQGQIGDTVSINLDVSGMDGVGALQFDLNYNASVIKANSVAWGSTATGGLPSSSIDNSAGKVTIGVISTTGISGTGNLATISFSVVGNAGASTATTISLTTLQDIINGQVTTNPTINSGTFTVIGEPTTVPTTVPTTEPTTVPTTEPTTVPTTEPTQTPELPPPPVPEMSIIVLTLAGLLGLILIVSRNRR